MMGPIGYINLHPSFLVQIVTRMVPWSLVLIKFNHERKFGPYGVPANLLRILVQDTGGHRS
jgi:hypothetical protein